MSEVTGNLVQSPHAVPETPRLHRRLRNGYFWVEWLNALASGYYLNYLFFYLQEHFGFGDRDNLLVTALYGVSYMFASWYGGRFGKKHGYFFALRLGLWGMAILMVVGGVAPHLLGYTRPLMLLELVLVALWTISVSFTWPSLQALLSQAQTPRELPHTAGIYNMVWAGASAFAYLTSGALLEKFGGEILFWVPAGMHVIQLLMLPGLERLNASLPPPQEHAPTTEAVPELNPRPIARARTFVKLAWIANPFAYMAIYGLIPIIPHIAQQFQFTPAVAGFVGSIWFWVRVVAFVGSWLWPGWHYKFRWILAAFIGLIVSYVAIPLSTQVWMLVAGQVVFGLVVGLIYYSSLFYSMDVGESRSKRGGFHEAAIGLGIFVGPATGVGALQMFPGRSHADVWAIGALLVIGLALFLWVGMRGRK